VKKSEINTKFGSAIKGGVGLVFGIVVSNNLRDALQAAQGLPVGAYSVDPDGQPINMPSLSKQLVQDILSGGQVDWAQVATKAGTTLTAASGVTPPADTAVKLCRRVNGSGTQAVINRAFLDNPCNTDGALSPRPDDGANSFAGSGSGDVEKCLQAFNSGVSQSITGVSGAVTVNSGAQKAWAVGVNSLEKAGINFSGAHYSFVAIDGAAPTARNTHDGKYQVWGETTIQYRVDGANALSGAKKELADYLRATVASKANVQSINAVLPVDAYLALSTVTGNVPQAGWPTTGTSTHPLGTNPVIAFTHGESKADNCKVPSINSAYGDKQPAGF
jgi:hypothetical protein